VSWTNARTVSPSFRRSLLTAIYETDLPIDLTSPFFLFFFNEVETGITWSPFFLQVTVHKRITTCIDCQFSHTMLQRHKDKTIEPCCAGYGSTILKFKYGMTKAPGRGFSRHPACTMLFNTHTLSI
jgi:hypothetical protein